MKRLIIIMLAMTAPLFGGLGSVFAQTDDIGMWLGADVTKKIDKKWSVGVDAEYRMRDNISATDRFSVGAFGAYKPTKWLKAEAGYEYLHTREPGGYTSSGNNYRSTYWYPRHRVYAGATGIWKINKRFRLTLRERWVYSYKPSYDVNRMNVNINSLNYGKITPNYVPAKVKNVLRSRLLVDYSIRKSPVSLFASGEIYNAWNIQKVRYSIGANYDFDKHNSVKAYYLFQDYKEDDEYDNVTDQHVFGVDYSFTF